MEKVMQEISDIIDHKYFTNDVDLIKAIRVNIEDIKIMEDTDVIIVLTMDSGSYPAEFTIFTDWKEYIEFISEQLEFGEKYESHTIVL